MTILSAVLLASLCAPSPFPPSLPLSQQDDSSRQGEEFAIEYFQPESAPPHEMVGVLKYLFANSQFQAFGESVLVRGPAADTKRVLEVMQRLDQEWTRGDGQRAATETLEHRASYVPLDSLYSALSPLLAQAGSQASLSVVEERGLLLARGKPAELAEMRSLLKRIDVPQPQVQVTCYLLEGAMEPSDDPRVPKELVQDLSAIVPYSGFELLSFGLFRSDALATIQMQESLPQGGEFVLELKPKSFEPSTGTITFERCHFILRRPTPGSNRSQSFTTSARVAFDEFVVLGALGSDPVFVVLRLQLVSG